MTTTTLQISYPHN